MSVVLSCNCIHAEYSCIIEAGIHVTVGATLYTTRLPCLWCSKVIIQARIADLVYLGVESETLKQFNEEKAMEAFNNAGIRLREFNRY